MEWVICILTWTDAGAHQGPEGPPPGDPGPMPGDMPGRYASSTR